MRRGDEIEERLTQSMHGVRLALPCRREVEAAWCEHIAFAFARDAGLHGIDVWYVAACTASVASYLLASGGGELELTVGDDPCPAVEVRALCGSAALGGTPIELRAAERYADELKISWQPGRGTVIVARRWLR